MSTIQDLTAAVTALTAAVEAASQPATVSVLTPADQAELDANVVAINAATAAETGEPATVQ
jgi:hypothetical protein